jgi:hypothetical protein
MIADSEFRMLLANSIALAQESCCFDDDYQVPPSLPELAPGALQMKLEWNRSLCVFIYLADEHLALSLGLEPLLPEKQRQIVKDQFFRVFSSFNREDSEIWERSVELASHLARARELLSNGRGNGSNWRHEDIVPALGHIQRSLDIGRGLEWGRGGASDLG